jgi:3-carboxy-cis,cis-muconate cycloisomerase
MNLLDWLFVDETMEKIWSADSTIEYWLRVEAELARALADVGVISDEEGNAIAKACISKNIDKNRLQIESRNVGYPIVVIINMICENLSENHAAKVHWGATTQDVMDTALVLQMREGLRHILELETKLADAISDLTSKYQATVLAGRTHGQQSTPTTFGAKTAVFLEQLASDRTQIFEAYVNISKISLFGASGTSSALFPDGQKVRTALAKRLNLLDTDIPWHVNRSSILRVGQSLSATLGTLSRLAREIIDLSRTEFGEVAEGQGMFKGASSTMPQKANPIECESILGFCISASSHAFALQRALETGHERSAGEWQSEWKVLPDIFSSTASALSLSISVINNLQVFPEIMQKNCEQDHGLLLAEAFMMHIAPKIGRDKAHRQLYVIAMHSRISGISFEESLREKLDPGYLHFIDDFSFDPKEHIGDAIKIAVSAVKKWQKTKEEVIF